MSDDEYDEPSFEGAEDDVEEGAADAAGDADAAGEDGDAEDAGEADGAEDEAIADALHELGLDDDKEIEGDGFDAAPFSALLTQSALPVTRRYVPPEEYDTPDALSAPEAARALLTRAAQIDAKGRHWSPRPEGEAVRLALAELRAGNNPLVVLRRVGASVEGDVLVEHVERRRVRELILPEALTLADDMLRQT